mmetsp:Transcript_9797/g.24940  ORF Transcript_9797/g.24940 Transcript_9797/m.24940 type:complete len:432 (+) Transcript_9797:56-1351(+)
MRMAAICHTRSVSFAPKMTCLNVISSCTCRAAKNWTQTSSYNDKNIYTQSSCPSTDGSQDFTACKIIEHCSRIAARTGRLAASGVARPPQHANLQPPRCHPLPAGGLDCGSSSPPCPPSEAGAISEDRKGAASALLSGSLASDGSATSASADAGAAWASSRCSPWVACDAPPAGSAAWLSTSPAASRSVDCRSAMMYGGRSCEACRFCSTAWRESELNSDCGCGDPGSQGGSSTRGDAPAAPGAGPTGLKGRLPGVPLPRRTMRLPAIDRLAAFCQAVIASNGLWCTWSTCAAPPVGLGAARPRCRRIMAAAAARASTVRRSSRSGEPDTMSSLRIGRLPPMGDAGSSPPAAAPPSRRASAAAPSIDSCADSSSNLAAISSRMAARVSVTACSIAARISRFVVSCARSIALMRPTQFWWSPSSYRRSRMWM